MYLNIYVHSLPSPQFYPHTPPVYSLGFWSSVEATSYDRKVHHVIFTPLLLQFLVPPLSLY
jgi:hypothetical protein